MQLNSKRSRVSVAVLALTVLGVGFPVLASSAASHGRSTAPIQASATSARSGAVDPAWIAATRVMNYYPARNGWKAMWLNWKPRVIQHDMHVTAALGANTIRIITFPYTMGWPRVRPVMERRVKSVLHMAKRAGLQVQLTLFDFWGQYNQLGRSRKWTQSLLGPIASSPQLRFIEVAAIRQDAPGVPVTVSALGQLGGMIALKQAIAPAKPDFWDLHYYGGAQQAYDTFGQARQVAAPLPLIIGEGGLSTDPSALGVKSNAAARDAQRSWFNVVDAAAAARRLPPVAPWTLFDFSRHGIPYPNSARSQHMFGLFQVDGHAKPAAKVVAKAFKGTLRPHVLNPGFTPLRDGSGLPQQWLPYYPSGTMKVARGAGPGSSNAVLFRGTRHLAGGMSSLYAIPMQPVIAGQRWSASILARGRRGTGTSVMEIAWYDNEGRWLASSSSANLPLGTIGWRTLHETATVPSGASSVRIYISSGGNAGSTWFSHPRWTVS
jgi:hypothetical protein